MINTKKKEIRKTMQKKANERKEVRDQQLEDAAKLVCIHVLNHAINYILLFIFNIIIDHRRRRVLLSYHQKHEVHGGVNQCQ